MEKNTVALPANKKQIIKFLTKWASVLVTFLIIVIFSLLMPDTFLTGDNIITIMRSIAVTTIIAMGLTIALSVDGFDLSSGQAATMAGTLVISGYCWFHLGLFTSILFSVIIMILLNLFVIFVILKFKVPDLLATLAMMFFYDGLSLTYSKGGTISMGMDIPWFSGTSGQIPTAFRSLGQYPMIIIVMLLCVLLVHIFLTYTKYGRYMYATGGNIVAARLAGIPVKRYRVIASVLSTVFIAIGGFVIASRNFSAQVQGANAYGMPAISAVFIGRSVAGAGKPNAVGTLIGAVLVGVLENGLVMAGVPYYSVNIVKGLVLLTALAAAYFSTEE